MIDMYSIEENIYFILATNQQIVVKERETANCFLIQISGNLKKNSKAR